MTPNRVPGPRGQASSGLQKAWIARVHMIRRRVITGSVALFVAVWMLIALMLVTGHDPALARQRTASVRSAPTTTATPSTTASSTTTASSPSTSSSTSSSGSSSGVSAVTSSQS
jgi:cytoskeletal protein RodZ